MNAPEGSKIKREELKRGGYRLSWKVKEGGFMNFMMALFLLFWLVMWGEGFWSAISQIFNNPKGPPSLFLIVWTIMWSIGGVFAIAFLYATLRPQRPESLTFNSDTLDYDPGTKSPVTMMFNFQRAKMPINFWSDLFKKKPPVMGIRKGEIQFVHERNPSRLYFDKGTKRIEIGDSLSEPEVDWLYAQIKPWSKPGYEDEGDASKSSLRKDF